jgi:hypothetical protein
VDLLDSGQWLGGFQTEARWNELNRETRHRTCRWTGGTVGDRIPDILPGGDSTRELRDCPRSTSFMLSSRKSMAKQYLLREVAETRKVLLPASAVCGRVSLSVWAASGIGIYDVRLGKR